MYSGKDDGELLPPGCPIRNSSDQSVFQLPEAYRRYHVLHRLLMPRHPPAALNSLTKKNLVQANIMPLKRSFECFISILKRRVLLVKFVHSK